MKILLSVKPEYIDKIFNGAKSFEYRRKLPQKPISAIVLYATDPIQKIVGEVEVISIISASPTALWEQTKHSAGISRAKYRKYFQKCKTANAFVLGTTTKYQVPKMLSDYGINSAPQSFQYWTPSESDAML